MMTPDEKLALETTLAEMRQVIHQRAEPMALAVLDSMDVWCSIAETPGHPAAGNARQLIARWVRTQERMRIINSGIHIARQVQD